LCFSWCFDSLSYFILSCLQQKKKNIENFLQWIPILWDIVFSVSMQVVLCTHVRKLLVTPECGKYVVLLELNKIVHCLITMNHSSQLSISQSTIFDTDTDTHAKIKQKKNVFLLVCSKLLKISVASTLRLRLATSLPYF
jgi:hypothetical protein